MDTPRLPHRHRPPALRQRGVYAVEYAFVFLLFFGLIYSIVCYSVVFTFRFGLQNAAEDGARAGLRYQPGASVQDSLLARLQKAEQVATERSQGWKPAAAELLVQSDVCQPDTGVCLRSGGAPDCAAPDWAQRCQLRVRVTLDQVDRVLPPIPFPTPERLAGEASVLLARIAP